MNIVSMLNITNMVSDKTLKATDTVYKIYVTLEYIKLTEKMYTF